MKLLLNFTINSRTSLPLKLLKYPYILVDPPKRVRRATEILRNRTEASPKLDKEVFTE